MIAYVSSYSVYIYLSKLVIACETYLKVETKLKEKLTCLFTLCVCVCVCVCVCMCERERKRKREKEREREREREREVVGEDFLDRELVK